MILPLTALLLGAATPVAMPCSPHLTRFVSHRDDEAAIRAAEAAWAASITRDEAVFLRRYTLGSFIAVFDGKVLHRASLIAGASQRRPGAATDRLERVDVHLFGSTAVAAGSEIWSQAGRQSRIVWSDVWLRCGGAWRLATSTAITARSKPTGSPSLPFKPLRPKD